MTLLSNVGMAACPLNAMEQIKNIPSVNVLMNKGGDGVVREFAEMILNYNM